MSFICDQCGKERKSAPYAHDRDGIAVCFICCKENERQRRKQEEAYWDRLMAENPDNLDPAS